MNGKAICEFVNGLLRGCEPYHEAGNSSWLAYGVYAVASLVVILLLALTVRIAMEYERGVVFRLGRYASTRGPGLYFLIPLIERAKKVSLRVETYEIDSQEMITRDSISLMLSAVVFFRVKEPRAAIIEVDDYYDAIEQFSLSVLRSAIGTSALDEVLANRDTVTERARLMLDEVTEHWGVEAQRVEIKQIELPDSMKRAMAREAEAVREKRARITKAEGEADAAQKLAEAARVIGANPTALEIRRLQAITEIGAEHNSTVVLSIPQEILSAANAIGAIAK
jgi:regulator of protease activity HflC (stomatin/prohibitin superfamily)